MRKILTSAPPSLLVGPFALVLMSLLWPAETLAGGGTRVVVTDLDGAGWGFVEEVPNGTGGFEGGPAGVPLGTGGISLSVDPTGRMFFATADLAGTRLADITSLEYSTYRTLPATGVVTVSLQFNIDYDLTDADTSWQGRLVFEPYYTETVSSGAWQTWDPMAGVWWGSGAPGSGPCPISNPCSWSGVLSNFPEAGVQAGQLSGVLFKAGGPWEDGFFGFVDGLSIGIQGAETVYDFETGLIFADGFESGDFTAWNSSVPSP